MSNCNEIIDSQIITDNVTFLDYCFENSFSLHSSVKCVKAHLNEIQSCTHENISKIKNNSLKTSLNVSTKSSNIKLEPDSQRFCQTLKGNVTETNLKAWGLPDDIVARYEEKGITQMFEWQVICLGNSKVLMDCANLVYSAPTSAGKTLVAEIIAIKTIFERQKKVLFILPFVSVVREKMYHFQQILSSTGIRVEGFMGSHAPPGGIQAVHVAICTIEKANSLINRLLDEGNISDIGAVIVDEMHLLADPGRGYILELLLTKVKYVSETNGLLIQIIGMSATLPNLDILSKWLNAELFVSHFRPIPLEEHCMVGNNIYNKNGDVIQSITQVVEGDNILQICLNTIKEGCSALIFCMTKNWCENLAQSIASNFFKIGSFDDDWGKVLRKQLNTEKITQVLEQLMNCPVGLDTVLRKTISYGVAFHHAGLTIDERDIIEGGFKTGALKILIATSTLSSGVNLPARRVIIRSPVFQKQPINTLAYKQMVGRAGRMGKDTKGDSILICTEIEKKIGFELMTGLLQPVKSCLEGDDKFMRAILEVIASEVATSREDLIIFSKCTLLFVQEHTDDFDEYFLKQTLEKLIKYEMIRTQQNQVEEHFSATLLGKACLSASMAPDDGISMFCELQKARQCLVLETDLHLIYLVTPYSVSNQWGNIDWLHFLNLWETCTKAMKRVGELVGIQESFIFRCVRGTAHLSNMQQKSNIHKRFYTALALQDLINECPLTEVSAKFRCCRGFLQSLQQASSTFAGMVTSFCRQLGWKNMEMLMSQFQDRLHFGVHSDVLDLMKLPSLNGLRARSLYNAGFETIPAIANANINDIENALYAAVPFQSDKERENDDLDDVRKRNKMKNIWITGHSGMTATEAAANLIKEARQYLEYEIGINEIKWKSIDNSKNEHNIIPNVIKEHVQTTQKYLENADLVTKYKHRNETVKKFEINEVFGMPGCIDNIKCNNTNSNKFDLNNVIKKHEKLVPKKVLNTELTNKEMPTKKIDIHLLKRESSLVIQQTESKSKSESFKNVTTSSTIVLDNIDNEISVSSNEDCKSNLPVKQQGLSNSKIIRLEFIDKQEIPLIKDCPEDVMWDTLEFTENMQKAFENLSNSRISDSSWSSVKSRSEKDHKAQSINEKNLSSSIDKNKDVSLFSSDEGDNSNLFEESLPVNILSSKLLGKDTDISNNLVLEDFENNLKDAEHDENFSLIYDDSVKSQNSSLTDDEIASSQETDSKLIDNNYTNRGYSNFKNRLYDSGEPGAKKFKWQYPDILKDLIVKLNAESFEIMIPKTNKKLKNTKDYGNVIVKCVILKEQNIEFLSLLSEFQKMSIFICIEMSNKRYPGIGINTLKRNENFQDNNIACKFHMKGLALYLGNEYCLYLDNNIFNTESKYVSDQLAHLFRKDNTVIYLYSTKFCYFYLKNYGIDLPCNSVDVNRNEWLIDSESTATTIGHLVNKYNQFDLSAANVKTDHKSTYTKSELEIIANSCVAAWSVWNVAETQVDLLRQQYQDFQKILSVEIEVAKILGSSEYYGVTIDKNLISKLLADVQNSIETLQNKAYKLCGYRFNMNSSKAVAKVLGFDKKHKISTKKSILCAYNNSLSNIIIYWRKLNTILTKTLYPLTRNAALCNKENRIYPKYTMRTSTGRISMHEPSLQNVPRLFNIPAIYLSAKNHNIDTNCTDIIEFNCRNIIRASLGNVLVSADYCQLEMRILTHYSKDEVLLQIMRSETDVFKSIAASWGCIPEEEVDDDLRQKAKQLCYGIIYGMGNRTLSQQLDVSEMEAASFMHTFYETYPAIKVFTQKVIDDCRRNGFVETLMKRRRHLPNIKSKVVGEKNAAERQAVNTTVQGSAADIAKAAMCAFNIRIEKYDEECRPRLVLQLHDELIYEVIETKRCHFIKILKDVMENTIKLDVPLPVRIKSGNSWGCLESVDIMQ